MAAKRRGFTLIELMIVVAIIAVIAAIAIPNLLRSKMAANETSAIAALHIYASGQAVFRRSQQSYAYPWYSLATLQVGGEDMDLIDPGFAMATSASRPRTGYWYQDIATNRNGNAYNYSFDYGLSAAPSHYNRSGVNTFIVDTQGTIYQKDISGAHVDRFPADAQSEAWVQPE